MKVLLTLALAILSTGTFGQTPTYKSNGLINHSKKISDASLKVVYANTDSSQLEPAYFLNDRFVSNPILGMLNPSQIESINVAKDTFQMDNIKYYGKVYIKTVSSYTPRLISLTDLKDRYTNLKGKPVLFMIDGSIVNGDYDKYMVIETGLLRIIIDNIENTKDKIDLGLIKLLTRSDENIKMLSEIRIKGTEKGFTE